MRYYLAGFGFSLVLMVLVLVTRRAVAVSSDLRQTQTQPQEQNRAAREAALEQHVTGSSEERQSLVDETRRAVATSLGVEIDAQCPFSEPESSACKPGYEVRKNADGVACCYVKPDTTELTKGEIATSMAKQIAQDVAVAAIADVVLAKVAQRVGKTAAGRAAGKATARAVARVSVKAAAGAAKVSGRFVAKAVILKAKLATMSAKLGLGPVGWAMLVFDVLSLALDLWDPAGYNDWVNNKLYKNVRNVAETRFEETAKNDGLRYPVLAHYLYDERTQEAVMAELMTLPAVIETYVDLYMDALATSPAANEAAAETEATNKIEQMIVDGHFDRAFCTKLALAGHKVKYVPGVGCSLNQEGCVAFNRYQIANKPEEDRDFAVYTDEYRELDPKNPGDVSKSPNVKTRKLPEKACLMSPLLQNAVACHTCKGGGCTFNVDAGMCDFSRAHCTRHGLKRIRLTLNDGSTQIVHNCKMYPGQKLAEIVFGTTITRGTIQAANLASDAFFDLSRKALPVFDGMPEIVIKDMMIKSAQIAVQFGHDVANLALKFGKDYVDIGARLAKGNVSPEIVLEAFLLGPKTVFGLGKLFANGVRDFTLTMVRGIKDMGEELFEGFEDIGDGIKKVFR